MHLITGEYPPAPGGVSDYTAEVAAALAQHGAAVHVWCPGEAGEAASERGVTVHRMLGTMSAADLARAGAALDACDGPRRLLLQWVPHAFGRRSLNLPFCWWVLRRAREGDRVEIMVHEPYLPLAWHPRRLAAALVHRIMTIILLRAASCVWVATPAWESTWRPYALGRRVPFVWLPEPASLPVHPASAAGAAGIRQALIPPGGCVLGTFSSGSPCAREVLADVIPPILERHPSTVLLLIGSGGVRTREAIVARAPQLASRLHATGALDASAVSAHLAACDLALQVYPDGICTRHSSALTVMAHGVPMVTTAGRFTESVWRTSGAVALVSAHDRDGMVRRAGELAGRCPGAARPAAPGARALRGTVRRAPYRGRAPGRRGVRIAIVRHFTGRVGGAETYAAILEEALSARGHDIAVFCESGGAATDAPAEPRWYAADGEREAVEALERWRPDLLFVQGLQSPALEERLLSICPAVLFAHGYAGLCISGHKMHRVPAATPCERTFGPACLALFFPRRCGGRSPLTALSDFRVQARHRRLIARYRRIIVGSRYMADEYARHGLGHLVSLLPIPLPAVPAGERVASDHREVLFCGRLEYAKGPAIALRAAARVAAQLRVPVRLTIAGAGSLAAPLGREAEALTAACPNLDVVFAGWIDGRAQADLLARTDVLAVPSLWPEPFGLVGIEAGMRGVPAIAFDVGGITEWLRDGVNGCLVPLSPAPLDAFAAALLACLALPAARFDELRAGARQVAARFTVAAHVDGLEVDLRGGRVAPVMRLRILFAIHAPCDPRTAVFRNVSSRAAHLRTLGHRVEIIGPEALGARRFGGLAPLLVGPLLLRHAHLAGYDIVVFHSHAGVGVPRRPGDSWIARSGCAP